MNHAVTAARTKKNAKDADLRLQLHPVSVQSIAPRSFAINCAPIACDQFLIANCELKKFFSKNFSKVAQNAQQNAVSALIMGGGF
ncbi:MAG: hypothetical protein IJL52_00845 [Clostridia bacterium]|nr:hypothetical protein [Clostridia bacterium]